MKKLVIGLAALFCLMGFTAAQAQVQFGVSGGSSGITNFYLAIGSYFKVPETQVTVIREKRIPDDQIPVVLFIAQKSHRTPAEVMELRSAGFSWMDVALRCKLTPEVFYVQLKDARGPYGNAYGYYKKYKKNQWRRIRLSDNDIVNFVNLRFISDHYRCQPDEVVVMRSKGRSFVSINDDWHARNAPKAAVKMNSKGSPKKMDKNTGRKMKGGR
jgi:hypothetical protein